MNDSVLPDPTRPAGPTTPSSPATTAARPPKPRRPPATYRFTRQVFLRSLGLIYLFAFLSISVQVDGLIGSRGLLPIKVALEDRARIAPENRFLDVPTLVWLRPTDGFLHGLCGAGVVLSILVMAGLVQAPALVGLWACYLSLVVAGQDFFGFQWDSLLLEAGLLAVFFAPLQMGPRLSRQPEPSPVARWLLWWLLFRLMFLSGLTKLTYGDPSWLSGTAMKYHYFSQPLPTWTSWYAYQLPGWFQWLSVWSMFAIEVIAPFAIFLGRWPRRVACAAIVLLQLLITATGNYGFFNLLSIVLCLTLLDDSVWSRLAGWRPWRRGAQRARETAGTAVPPDAGLPAPDPRAAPGYETPAARGRLYWPWWVTVPVAAVLVPLTIVEGVSVSTPGMLRYEWPKPVQVVRNRVEPFHAANWYALFRVMTQYRLEVVVQGSRDGRTWQAYEFKWKPGDPHRPPRYATPHMPRLDWQIWMPFLGRWDSQRWLINFQDRLLRGTPEVLGLLDKNPFPDAPPKYVRLVVYEYRFTTADERAQTGDWWVRYVKGLFGPPLTLDPETKALMMVEDGNSDLLLE